MTHDEMIEAVARALCKLANGDRIDPDEKWNGQPWWAAFIDDARAAIRVIAPAVEQEAVAKIVAWLRDQNQLRVAPMAIATAIEAGEWK